MVQRARSLALKCGASAKRLVSCDLNGFLQRMKLPRILVCAALVSLTVFGTACSKKNSDHGHAHGHHHHAPHGGTLVELGDHQFNLEWVRDAAAGTLTAYVLDAHAENFIRVPWPSLAIEATYDGNTHPLALTAVSNPATGETVGATSQFAAQAEWLKTVEAFRVRVPAVEIRGTKFTDIVFAFPQEAHTHAH